MEHLQPVDLWVLLSPVDKLNVQESVGYVCRHLHQQRLAPAPRLLEHIQRLDWDALHSNVEYTTACRRHTGADLGKVHADDKTAGIARVDRQVIVQRALGPALCEEECRITRGIHRHRRGECLARVGHQAVCSPDLAVVVGNLWPSCVEAVDQLVFGSAWQTARGF